MHPARQPRQGPFLLTRAPVHRQHLAAGRLEHAGVLDGAVHVGEHSDLARDGDREPGVQGAHCGQRKVSAMRRQL